MMISKELESHAIEKKKRKRKQIHLINCCGNELSEAFNVAN